MSDAAHEPISRMPDLYALDLETPWTAGRDSLHCLKDAKRKLQPTAEGRIATRFTAESPWWAVRTLGVGPWPEGVRPWG